MVAGLSKVICPLLAANALEATSRASPMIRVFETLANFIAAPFSSPVIGIGLGRPGSQIMGENTLSFPRNRLQCLPLGLSAQALKLALPLWGFPHLGRQTERERIPKPR